MAPIPYALVFQASAQGSVPKLVECDQCQFEYVYLLSRSVETEQTSLLFLDNERAREDAERLARTYLQESLDQGCEVVPCPKCGWVQEHMVQRARELHYRWMDPIAVGL